jgi:hypothetical protein
MEPGSGIELGEYEIQDQAQILAQLAHIKEKPAKEVFYEPQTALAGIYTVGCKNVAITGIAPKPPDSKEVSALRRYDAIIAPTEADRDALQAVGLEAMHVPPDGPQLQTLLDDLCGSDTSATSPSSPATAAPPTTISRPLTTTSKSRLRSSASGTLAPNSSPAIISLPGSSAASFPRRIWRSITRRLARLLLWLKGAS